MKTETKVVITVLLALMALEVGSRLFEPKLSRDVRNILAYKEIPEAVVEVERDGGTSVLVIGNSLARACMNEDALKEEFALRGYENPSVFYMTPDATSINEWATAFRKYFPQGSAMPDFVFVVTGPEHLLDYPVRSPEKLAAFHTSPKDKKRVFSNWLDSANSRGRFVIAGISRLFANRERIRPLLFYNLVPGFEVTAQRINQSTGANQGRESGSSRDPVNSASRFDWLLASIQMPSENVFVVGAALPEAYEVPIVVKEIARGHGVAVLEEEAVTKWPSDAFPDGYHLSGKYSDDFSRRVVSRILPQPRTE